MTAIDFIKKFEGCKLKAYQKKGDLPTIGYGTTFYPNGVTVKLGDVITQSQADEYLSAYIVTMNGDIKKVLKAELNPNQRVAIMSFVYNFGITKFKKSTLLKKININPEDPSIRDEFAKWISKGTIFEKGLRIRRAAEADIYFTPC